MINRFTFYLILTFAFLNAFTLTAQDQQQTKAQKDTAGEEVIQFSGLVVAGDSLYGLRGVHVFVPFSGRGTSSNEVGYFSFPVLKGDSVKVSAIGYKDQHYIVPDTAGESHSKVFELKVDTTVFPTVDIFPYPTELMFKHAFLNLDMEKSYEQNARQNLNPQIMNRILEDMGMDASENYTYYMNEEIEKEASKHMMPTISLLDPFAWKRFIEDIKEGKYKKEEPDWNQH